MINKTIRQETQRLLYNGFLKAIIFFHPQCFKNKNQKRVQTCLSLVISGIYETGFSKKYRATWFPERNFGRKATYKW